MQTELRQRQTKKQKMNQQKKDLLLQEQQLEKDDEPDVTDEQRVVIESVVAKTNDEAPAKSIRQDWVPFYGALIPLGFTPENVDDFKNRHCGNCDRGFRSTRRHYSKSESLWGCGIRARVEWLGNGYAKVTSHCSGQVNIYPEGLISKST